MKKIFSVIFAAIIFGTCFVTLTTSCSEKREGWTIRGTIEGAADSTLFVEEPSGAAWVILDSVKTDGNGNFSYTAKQRSYNDGSVYRVRLGDRTVYFPVDSTETLTLTGVNTNFDMVHSLSGSPAAEGFNTVDSLVNAAVERVGETAALNDSLLIQQLGDIIINDTTCIVSYYTIKHPIGNRYIFNTDTKRKVGLIGAVATRFKTQRPNDPRGEELAEVYNRAKALQRGNHKGGSALMATEVGRPTVEFSRPDKNGVEQDLNAVIDRGGVTVLNLIRYDDALASANTMALGDLYDKYKSRGLEIYQIGFDPNEAFWRQNALNMPWITVYSHPAEATELLVQYNANPIDGGPVSLLFNRNGELVKRITNPAELDSAVAQLF